MSGHSKWSTIKHKKGILDNKRGKIFTKILKEITVAAKIGGCDLNANSRLRLAVDYAKSNNMPKDTWERAIKKGVGDLDGISYEDVVYEGYGPGGVALLVEAITDNRNRTTPEIRSYFNKFGCELSSPNTVAYMFQRQGQIIIDPIDVAEERIIDTALNAGADDVYYDDGWIVVTDPSRHQDIKKFISIAGLSIIEDKLAYTSSSKITVDGEKLTSLLKLLNLLENNDDVQNVWDNLKQ